MDSGQQSSSPGFSQCRAVDELKEDDGEGSVYPQIDSGYASLDPSPQSVGEDIGGIDLPGTGLKYFNRPIPPRLRERFFDIKVLYTQSLNEAISKKRYNEDVSMKPKYLGLSKETARLYIVIQCERRIARRVRRFFEQKHVEEDLGHDFRIFVLDKQLQQLADTDPIEVFTHALPVDTLCGTPLRLAKGGEAVEATLGGVILVETSKTCLYGLTAGHFLRRLIGSASASEDPEDSDTSSEDVDMSSIISSDASKGEINEVSPNSDISMNDASENEGLNSLDSKVMHGGRYLGLIDPEVGHPMTENYDWAIIELESQDTLPPNAIIRSHHGKSDDHSTAERARQALPRILFSSSWQPRLTCGRVSALTRRGLQPGKLMYNNSYLMMRPGSEFVTVHDLTLDSGGLSLGDSGSWVLDESTGEVYGHVVSVDAFGEAQVMPIQLTLESIRKHFGASRVVLPALDNMTSFHPAHLALLKGVFETTKAKFPEKKSRHRPHATQCPSPDSQSQSPDSRSWETDPQSVSTNTTEPDPPRACEGGETKACPGTSKPTQRKHFKTEGFVFDGLLPRIETRGLPRYRCRPGPRGPSKR